MRWIWALKKSHVQTDRKSVVAFEILNKYILKVLIWGVRWMMTKRQMTQAVKWHKWQ